MSLAVISGCSTVITSAGNNLADQLGRAVASSDDLETVKDGIPAYMLLLEGIMQDDTENPDLLLSSANLYAAYATIFVTDSERQRRMASKAHNYSLAAACLEDDDFCNLKLLKYDQFTQLIDEVDEDEVDLLFTLGKSWAAHMQASSDDWNQVVHLPKVQYIMERVIAIDGTIDNGNAHYYLGIIHSLVPPALGGKPQLALKHFEEADQIANQQNLMIKVTLAERYARVIFDRDLHDKWLKEVIANQDDFAQYRLINTIAKEKAEALLKSADEFF
ncbi:TRAP transporter TatT component family protein [Aliikangiella marina]|nr:TRAP transporter TatT component family protein [Aliikangiella marina]